MAQMQSTKPTCYQLKITLKDIKPPIWRRLLVDSKVLLPDLHKIIQTAMGWTNSHLHQFRQGDRFYALPSEDDFIEVEDYRRVKLKDLLSSENQKIIYEYDFGDGWEHVVLLEKILAEETCSTPVCVKGKRNCPPEDCGGPYGYQDLLDALASETHPRHKHMVQWIGPDYDDEYFDLEETNEMLQSEDYGCITLDWDE